MPSINQIAHTTCRSCAHEVKHSNETGSFGAPEIQQLLTMACANCGQKGLKVSFASADDARSGNPARKSGED